MVVPILSQHHYCTHLSICTALCLLIIQFASQFVQLCLVCMLATFLEHVTCGLGAGKLCTARSKLLPEYYHLQQCVSSSLSGGAAQ